MPGPIESYLTQAADLGRWDSQGAFTVAREAGLRKLASSQLPRPSAWVLKLLQAAVRGKAASLRVDTNKEITTFEYEPAEALSADDLEERLISPGAGRDSAAQHLAVGLRAVGFGQNRKFAVVIKHQTKCRLIYWNGDAISRQELELEDDQQSVQVLVAHGPDAASMAKEKEELRQYGQASPVALFHGKERLDTLASPIDASGRIRLLRLCLAMVPPVEFPDVRDFEAPSGLSVHQHRQLSDRLTDNRFLELMGDPAQREVSVLIRLLYNFSTVKEEGKVPQSHPSPRPSACYWLKDGVVCGTSYLFLRKPEAASLEIFLSADDLETDITGLQLRELHKHEGRMKAGLSVANAVILQTISKLKSHWTVPTVNPYFWGSFIGIGSAMTLLPEGPCAYYGLALAIAGVLQEGADSMRQKATVKRDCISSLRSLARNFAN